MILYEEFGKKGYLTSIATSFGIDFASYENIMLSRFREAGCPNNLVICDTSMLSLALEEGTSVPRQAGRTYSLVPARSAGVFHPKVIVQLGRSGGRVIVSSANITAPGLAGNLEVVGLIEAGSIDSPEASLVAAAFAFVSKFLPVDHDHVRGQLDWLRSRTPWIYRAQAAEGAVRLNDGSQAAFVGSDGDQSILRRFTGLIGDEKIRRLMVISPYWDSDLKALNALVKQLQPKETVILVDHGQQAFEVSRLDKSIKQSVKLIDFKKGNRFVHAKVFIAQTRNADHVLFGSANCTSAALGGARSQGVNAEASLYRKLPADAGLASLKLEEAIKGKPIPHGRFEPAPLPEELPIEELKARFPGTFSCLYETLTWLPPAGTDTKTATIELLNADRTPWDGSLAKVGSGVAEVVRFQLTGATRPAFARVRHRNRKPSSPAIITWLDVLRESIREKRSTRAENIVNYLNDETTQLNLMLLELLNDFEAAEIAQAASPSTSSSRSSNRRGKRAEEESDGRYLSYADFIAGRRLRSDIVSLERNSFAGSDISHFRILLDRLLDLNGVKAVPEDERALQAAATNFADEVADGADAIEDGQDTGPKKEEAPRPAPNPLADAARRREGFEELVYAIDEMIETIGAKASDDGLRSIDLLRLRAMLMILAAAAWNTGTAPCTDLAVVPLDADPAEAWPRLVGKILFAFFGGTKAAITTLKLDAGHDQLPADFIECWATCIWALLTSIAIAAGNPKYRGVAQQLKMLSMRMYALIGFDQADFYDQRVLRQIDALSERFKASLSVDSKDLRQLHAATVEELMRASS